jgi:hypothetical protein
METCKAIIQEGPRKGETCKFPPSSHNEFCGRHQRNYQYNQHIEFGNIPCRFFFRGCDNLLENNQKSTCTTCLKKSSKKIKECEHIGCKFKTDGSKYCKKHERDKYRDEEKEKGIKYCDISRGCYSICEGNLKSCKECLEKDKIYDNNRYKIKQEHNSILSKNINTIHQICCSCGKDYEKFMTLHNKPSTKCKECNIKQSLQDSKRQDRNRNYKNENLQHLDTYYKRYINNALKRKYTFEIQFEDFKELVKSPCYYCNYYLETEINGIDRVDNSKGYTKENSAACCSICNRIKSVYHPKFFIEKCQLISKNKIIDNHYLEWNEYYYRCKKYNYLSYKYQSELKREIPFNITKEEWDSIIYQPCYLCGYKSQNGVGLDRVDNTIREYTIHNVKPCCGSCNNMKNELTLDEFLKKANEISSKWSDTLLFDSILHTINPIEEAITKDNSKNSDERKGWKVFGIYYSILAGSDEYYKSQKEIITQEEYTDIKKLVLENTKEHCKEILQKFLVKLNKRRKRLNSRK